MRSDSGLAACYNAAFQADEDLKRSRKYGPSVTAAGQSAPCSLVCPFVLLKRFFIDPWYLGDLNRHELRNWCPLPKAECPLQNLASQLRVTCMRTLQRRSHASDDKTNRNCLGTFRVVNFCSPSRVKCRLPLLPAFPVKVLTQHYCFFFLCLFTACATPTAAQFLLETYPPAFHTSHPVTLSSQYTLEALARQVYMLTSGLAQ
jgi:hypothetical protein